MKWSGIIAALLLLSGLPTSARAAGVGAALQYSLQHRDGEEQDGYLSQSTTAELNGNTALWRDWFARVDGRLRLTETRTESNDRSTDNSLVTGGGTFSLFPRSRFPFRAFFDRTDSRVDSSIGTDADRQVTNYGLSQRYLAQAGGRYGLDYRRRRIEELGFGQRQRSGDEIPRTDVVEEQLDLSAQRRFGRHELAYDFNAVDTERRLSAGDPGRRGGGTHSSSRTHVLSHQFSPQDNRVSLSNRLSTSWLDNERGVVSGEEERGQFTSNVNWRPDTVRPSRVNANALWRERADRDSAGETEHRFASLRVRGTYDWTDALTIGGNASLSEERDGGVTETTSEQAVDASYRPDGLRLGRFSYDWSGGVSVLNRTNSAGVAGSQGDEDLQRLAANLGHTLSRRQRIDEHSSVVWRFSQRGQGDVDTVGGSDRSLRHSISGTWNSGAGARRTFVQARLTDNRQFGDSEDTFQLATLQANSSMRLSEVSDFSADLTLQVTRDVDKDTSPSTVSRDTSTAANLVYRNSRFRDINRLTLRSELSYISDSLLQLVDDRNAGEERPEELSWTNRLDYRIGRLDLRTDFELAERGERLEYRLFFTLRRTFGSS